MAGIWRMWKPDCNFELLSKYYIDQVIDSPNGLFIYLSDLSPESAITIDFPGFICAYRNREELAALNVLNDALPEDPCGISKWTFFIVENSEYTKQIAQDSQDIYTEHRHIHFAIIAGQCLFEVVTDAYPRIRKGIHKDGIGLIWGDK